MIVEYAKEIEKTIKKLKNGIAKKRLDDLIKKLEEANNLKEISNVEPISNYPYIYRIRTGDYRLLVEYYNGAITILLLDYAKRNEKTYREYR
jgi:mRNA-degrading endonuclease RelE of RelBE toxin-antitoxin system